MYFLKVVGMPSKHIDKETWEAIERFKERMSSMPQLISDVDLLKLIIKRGIKDIEKEDKKADFEG